MIIACDYASVDGNRQPDWARFQAACRDAGGMAGLAIFRGAWGTSADPTVRRDWRSARQAGLICGAYLYLRMRPDIRDAQSPEDQCHVFADNVGSLIKERDARDDQFQGLGLNADLVPILDIEDDAGDPQIELELVQRAWTTMVSIYGVPPILYTSNRVWREDLADLPAGDMVDSPLWLAKPWPWPVHSTAQLIASPFSGGKLAPQVPAPWGAGNWWMHQYQGDAFPTPGFNSTVDLSRFGLMVLGEQGPRVRWVRRRLGLGAGDLYDGAMAKAVRDFQLANGLAADAIIGPRTFSAICWTVPRDPDLVMTCAA